jgi:hypothetical protein
MLSFQHGLRESRLTWTSPDGILVNLGSGDPCRNHAAPPFHPLKASISL